MTNTLETPDPQQHALSKLRDTYTTKMQIANDAFSHMLIYSDIVSELHISHMVGQLCIMQDSPGDFDENIHIIIAELAKAIEERDARANTNKNDADEFQELRAYARCQKRYQPGFCKNYQDNRCTQGIHCTRFHGTRSEHAEHMYTYRFITKVALCTDTDCTLGLLCQKFHGSRAKHLAYLRRHNYKMYPHATANKCNNPNSCIFYHDERERDAWLVLYTSAPTNRKYHR